MRIFLLYHHSPTQVRLGEGVTFFCRAEGAVRYQWLYAKLGGVPSLLSGNHLKSWDTRQNTFTIGIIVSGDMGGGVGHCIKISLTKVTCPIWCSKRVVNHG